MSNIDPSAAWWEIFTNRAVLAMLGAITGAFAWVFTAGKKVQKFSGRLDRVENDQTELATTLAKINDDIKRRLYRSDGESIYVPAVRCAEMSEKCRSRIEKSLDELKSDVKELIKLHTKDAHEK